jgi:hypothetical protein
MQVSWKNRPMRRSLLEKRLKSKCCKADIAFFPGKDKVECSKCNSPTFYIEEELDHLEKYYLIGIQKAINETSK